MERGVSVLRQVAQGVWIHESEFVQSNAVVVRGNEGALLIDPGVHDDEMDCLANDLASSHLRVAAGFSTHPHWDHLLWHPGFGDVPRYGTARCAAATREAMSAGLDRDEHGIPEEVSLDLFGLIVGLPAETVQIPWDGPVVRIAEHQGHAPGHAALLIEDHGVLVAGDMLSDVLIPLLDADGVNDPIEEYLVALRLLEGLARDADVLVPGHGSIAVGDQVQARIDVDRAYVESLGGTAEFIDPRFSSEYCRDWLPGVHAQQIENLGQRLDRYRPTS